MKYYLFLIYSYHIIIKAYHIIKLLLYLLFLKNISNRMNKININENKVQYTKTKDIISHLHSKNGSIINKII